MKLLLVEVCEEGEMGTAVAVLRLTYEAHVPPGLSVLQPTIIASCQRHKHHCVWT